MKKGFLFILLLTAILSSCQKEEKAVFEQSADERLAAKLLSYQTQLAGAQYGWKGVILTDGGTGTAFSFYFKFNDANRVTMLSDFDSLSAVTSKESSYRLKALQQPSLVFDTYSYLHVLSDPEDSINGGVRGLGYSADFEFYFDTTTTDSINLVGRFNGSKLTLVRATQAEQTAYNSGALSAGLFINKIITYFKRLTVGSQAYDVSIDPITRQFTFTWLDGNGTLQTFSTGYYLTVGGVVFNNALVNGAQTITGFTSLSWNAATETINLTTAGTAATITGVARPLLVDVAAPRRWWDYAVNNNNDYWISPLGFHVNGVDDGFNIRSLASGGNTYYYLIYWPEYAPGNDFFGPIFLNQAQTGLTLLYGTAPSAPTFTSDGRAIFTQLGNYGPYPATGPAGLSRALLYQQSGFYFIQTSPTSYDMISASDGKSWISWQF